MIEASTPPDFAELAPAPRNPLPYREQLKAIKAFHTGQEVLRDAGGHVTRLKLAPKWVSPEFVIATSPGAARDILGHTGSSAERAPAHEEVRQILGASLFTMTHDRWLPRRRALQPLFTKHNVRAFGGHMTQAAEAIAASWGDAMMVDLDAECRRLTLRALGRSILGIDLDARIDAIAEPLRTALGYVTARLTTPVKPPRWLPTPARRRARAAAATLRRVAAETLQACRDDATRDAPLVRAMIAAVDPITGRALTDDEICDELVVFMVAGHDTTATTLSYALWSLGRHPDMQDKVRAEADAIGARELTADDVPRLAFTVRVLHESLRLCPPGPSIPRLITHDIEVAGHLVKAGTVCAVGVYALHRDPALWDDPLRFDPDRFTPQNSKGRDRWQYIPFSAGPRTCIGDHFAMLEATLALATIIRRTEIHSLEPDYPLALPFTMVAAAPVHAQVEARTRDEV
ncbi:cytochrome P450 [Mycobacterium sp. NPDC050551]|uniref:cytochrome P450 n=1 Tax=Mycobacterium sp. NPDC050551 TaxID=3155407 RepID=UPI0034470982